MFARLLADFQGYGQVREKRMGIEQVEMPATKFIFLTEIQLLFIYFLINASGILVSLWLMSRVLKKLILIIFVSVVDFIEGQIYGSLTPPFWKCLSSFPFIHFKWLYF